MSYCRVPFPLHPLRALSPSFSLCTSFSDSGFLSVSLVSFQSPSLECWQKHFFSLKTKRLTKQMNKWNSWKRMGGFSSRRVCILRDFSHFLIQEEIVALPAHPQPHREPGFSLPWREDLGWEWWIALQWAWEHCREKRGRDGEGRRHAASVRTGRM